VSGEAANKARSQRRLCGKWGFEPDESQARNGAKRRTPGTSRRGSNPSRPVFLRTGSHSERRVVGVKQVLQAREFLRSVHEARHVRFHAEMQ
jgi:hypothetical protein